MKRGHAATLQRLDRGAKAAASVRFPGTKWCIELLRSCVSNTTHRWMRCSIYWTPHSSINAPGVLVTSQPARKPNRACGHGMAGW